MVISIPYIAGEMVDLFNEFESLPEFQQVVTYRCFTNTYDPMTGDVDTSVYKDYSIYATVDLLETEHKLVEAGELNEGDAIVFVPSLITKKTDGTVAIPQVRPKAHDFIVFNNITYRVESLTFPMIGDTEIFAKLYCQRMKDESTVSNVTTVPYIAGEILDLFYEYITTPEFQQVLVYRHFTFSKDSMTGDLDLSTYTDYDVYGTIDVSNIEKILLSAGELTTSNIVIWLDARLSKEIDGTVISPQIRPTINDYIIYDGVTYRIAKITFYITGTNEMFAKIGGIRLSSINPVRNWNDSYDSTTFKVGGGYS
jgi:hypothetical protein